MTYYYVKDQYLMQTDMYTTYYHSHYSLPISKCHIIVQNVQLIFSRVFLDAV